MKKDFNDEDGKMYRDTLINLMDYRKGQDDGEIVLPDFDIVDSVPEQRGVDEEQFEDMLDGDFYYEDEKTVY